jgi:AmmeMemoRadiSam system protein B
LSSNVIIGILKPQFPPGDGFDIPIVDRVVGRMLIIPRHAGYGSYPSDYLELSRDIIGKMIPEKNPRLRTDLELIPIQHGNQQLILIRDALGLVEEGRALPLALYEVMALLDGKKSLRDVQMALMRQKRGVLVGMDEVERLIAYLDESFLLDTERYQHARRKIIARFAAEAVRPCSHSGRSYPAQAEDLKEALDKTFKGLPFALKPEETVTALIAPHIDISVGSEVYGNAYACLKYSRPSRVVVLGVGHHMMGDLFCLTDKDFETPLGRVKNDRATVKKLREECQPIISDNDFYHKAEHSLEFQLIFLQHLLSRDSFTIIPILCGSLKATLSHYTRDEYLEKASSFLAILSDTLHQSNDKTLIVAGVDFSHIGPKFGHDMPASYLEGQSEKHDQLLLKAISEGRPNAFWEESIHVKDRFNVCGFSAMACLMEILPPSRGRILKYQIWHEAATRSAVSFAAVVFHKDADGQSPSIK